MAFGKLIPDGAKWVHALNAVEYAPGQFIGWPDAKSPTRFYGGVVVMADIANARVLVRDIKPAEVVPGVQTKQRKGEP